VTHEGVFLADILADPGDDFPRLAFADYLEETGADPVRAEFIRVQLRLADPTMGPCACFPSRWPGRVYECRGCALRRREYELRGDERFPSWCPRAVADAVMASTYRRGFVGAVTLPTAAFLAHAAALFRAAPITGVRLEDVRPSRSWNEGRHSHVWTWWSPGNGPAASQVPAAVWRNLVPPRDADPMPWHRISVKDYPSPEAAHAALSAACTRYGRSLAGLPALAPA
jgi:uncharacterized protein (TIGR02996 family)